ncbi:MAG: YeeE/YedE family protein [Marinifilaceae bacterium]|jgi:uncharacterized membrane protein YedE/YeeE|nr:YeeE/YedE family protein [Marinifilaceae bacterium]
MDNSRYLNPYIGGLLLGLVLLSAIFIAGRGLGASGGVKGIVIGAAKSLSKDHTENSVYYKEYISKHQNPFKTWLVFELLGLLFGALISGFVFKRLKFKIEHSPKISSKKRLLFALLGGVFFGFGAMLARGCTSGSALSGMAVMSLAGFVSMAAIFGTAFILAYFFRKLWI